MSGIGAAFGAVENLTQTMAIELGPGGVRAVCLRTAANPDTLTIQVSPAQATASLAEGTTLKASPRTSDTARAAAFLASYRALIASSRTRAAARHARPRPGQARGRPEQGLPQRRPGAAPISHYRAPAERSRSRS
jgi:NAD(P)-dependent dehydrogenase (short-subunit alcohol dehydrogenase family)